MEKQYTVSGKTVGAEKPMKQNRTKAFCRDEKMSCSQCSFSDQDIDTYLCARCHTRH